MKTLKKLLAAVLCAAAVSGLSGCDSDAGRASSNLARAADNFEINRRIVFFNGITDTYLLSIEGLCAFELEAGGKKVAVTCKTGPGTYKKHTLGLSDNVSFFSEQLDSAAVSTYHYRVIFKPANIIPDVQIK